MLHPARHHRPLALLAGLLALAAVPSACSSVASPPNATTEAGASVSSPIAVPSTAPSIGTTTEASFADWIEVQGFGGSSGLREINKLVKLENESPSAATEYEIRDQLATIGALRAWLDAHRPRACWADYHAAVRSGLATLASGYATIREAVSVGKPFPADVSESMVTVSAKLLAMEQPPGCD
jgi:hypothetical protein